MTRTAHCTIVAKSFEEARPQAEEKFKQLFGLVPFYITDEDARFTQGRFASESWEIDFSAEESTPF